MMRNSKYQLLFCLFFCGLATATDRDARVIDLEKATVLDIQAAFDRGFTAEQLVDAYLARIDAYDQQGPAINAMLTLNPRTRETARALDRERRESGPRSPLHGIPVIVKDNIDTYDMPTTGGAEALAGLPPPPRDAFVIDRLREAGAIILGKTNLDEFARGGSGTSSLGGQVLNAYHLERIPGGSSSGSAQGVAALFAQVAIGTETGSSIRNPATKGNIVGFSPSHGLVSRGGVLPISINYDRVGPMTRNVTDAAITMAVIAGTDMLDLYSFDGLGHTPDDHYKSSLREGGLEGARIGVLRDLFGDTEADEPVIELIDQAIETMTEEGAVIIDPMPNDGNDLWQLVDNTRYDRAENRPAMELYFMLRGPDFPFRGLDDLVEHGGILGRLTERYRIDHEQPEVTGNARYIARHRERALLRAHVEALMDRWQVDALVYPHETLPVRTLDEAVPDSGETPMDLHDIGRAGYGNRISTATGLPTMTVPAGFDPDGVPVGIEILTRLYDESVLIRLAYAYERAAPHRRLPPTTPPIGVEQLEY